MADLVPRTYRLFLKPGRDRSVTFRHPWLFSGAIASVEALEGAEPGDLGEIWSSDGKYMAVATVNPESQIIGRILRWTEGEIDDRWVRRGLESAYRYRREILNKDVQAYRWIHGEGDRFPGLIVDQYHDFIVVQPLSLLWYRILDQLAERLLDISGARGVLLRTENAVRDSQIPGETRTVAGEDPPDRLEIREGPARLLVDLKGGQKTGLYLDQRLNRISIGRLAAGRNVLVPFAYTGGFGLHAALCGARRVTLVDSSGPALELARENWAINGIKNTGLDIVKADAWDYLRGVKSPYGLIILDPPSLAKAARHVDKASRGYKDINMQAMKLLDRGGWLATFSCSQHITTDLFQKIVFGASRDAGVPMQWVERLGAGPDHPVSLDHPQGEYLKGMLLRGMDLGETPGEVDSTS
ncbi:MAG: class I SAM-dependent rRNA methyltransferase [Candidatus Eisenbacteria bacterium]|uniref:Class I SAM-dependent rRNA methyltransferase n=1 Tax=Eiseniibacteriota bacterium TaxID=2212470 RepID=A0A948RTJ5_UNCEI|nr:class I SAM-dependent rRNA methyltransferase [Candidatus Eisenbacteria bacterium]MBU1947588.1 class I SAM-dependent rRNA methyltransferase [Candidatus Eisenbacteria bacterium]MBU2690291.1 class I SAM-dependent rRNA methyltransferase [Candidatus Eisenbacteria bacterium]